MLCILLCLMLQVSRSYAAAVFAHFMVTNSENYTFIDWEDEFNLAIDAHIDAFALNMAYADPVNDASISQAFNVADTLGFHLFFSFDYAGNGPWPKAEVIDIITTYSGRASYFLHGGQPFVSTFEGSDSAADWHMIKSTTGCFFMPDWSSLGAKAALELGVADGLFSWAAWPWGDEDMNTYVDASYLQYLNGMPYMMPASPWFFTNLPGYDKNWLWRGDHLWFDRWEEIKYLQPDFVEIVTWNDYGESHYIGPLYDKAMAAFVIGEAPYNYVDEMPHDAWRMFLPYLIDTYKSGIATVTEEGISIWHRIYPAAACDSGYTSGNTASQLQIEFDPATIVQDRIFFSALLGSDADVVVTTGGVAQTVEWSTKPDGGIGVYHGSVPFGIGDVFVDLERSGTTLARVGGFPISTDCPVSQNFNAYTAGSWTGEAISATPKLTLSEQSCIKGTGTGNFEGICEFACENGYCPSGACTCLQMGKKNLTTATGPQGYPIAGEDANYSGLCMFDCSHGDCPPTACGAEEVPLSVATVSPFLPPACTAGEGEGNLGGLCGFSCAHGYCPRVSCTCTSEGVLNLLEPTVDVLGSAASGLNPILYDGLCNFACQRGYCPEGACQSTDSSSGSSGGSVGPYGTVYVDPTIWVESSPTVACVPPCTMVFPPLTLTAMTTIPIPDLTTTITRSELSTSTFTLYNGSVYELLSYELSAQTIIVPIPPVTTSVINVWNHEILTTPTGTTRIPMTESLDLPTLVISLEQGPFPTITSLTPPPWPWATNVVDPRLSSFTIDFRSGDPSPTCVANCGTACSLWCGGPCLDCYPWGLDYDAGEDGDDENDDEDDCEDQEAEHCSAYCAGSSCTQGSCTTVTGCSVTASTITTSYETIGFETITAEAWPTLTYDTARISDIAASFDIIFDSMFGPLPSATTATVTTPTATPTSSAGDVKYYWLVNYYHVTEFDGTTTYHETFLTVYDESTFPTTYLCDTTPAWSEEVAGLDPSGGDWPRSVTGIAVGTGTCDLVISTSYEDAEDFQSMGSLENCSKYANAVCYKIAAGGYGEDCSDGVSNARGLVQCKW